MSEYNVLDYGALADGRQDDAAAIQAAIDACVAAGGGRVLIPAGTQIRAGFFELGSGVDFHVAEGACLLSATELDSFPRMVFESGLEAGKRMWIGCRHARNVQLSGSGVIDGQCHAFALEEGEHGYTKTLAWRPAMTCFEDIQGITISGLTFRNSANWTLHLSGCQDVVVRGVCIDNDLKFPNADGIDPDHCQRVLIEDCDISAADDCVVLKNTENFSQYGPCEDIEVRRCRLRSVSAAIKIGSESHDSFRRIRFHDCQIRESNRGLAIQLRDGGDVEDVEFSHITIESKRYAPMWWGAGEVISITNLPRQPEVQPGAIRSLRFNDIHCRGENGIVLYADARAPIEDVHFSRISLEIRPSTDWSEHSFDLRPCPMGYGPSDGTPIGKDGPWGRKHLRDPAAWSIEGARGVCMEEVLCRLPAEGWQVLRGDRQEITGTPSVLLQETKP